MGLAVHYLGVGQGLGPGARRVRLGPGIGDAAQGGGRPGPLAGARGWAGKPHSFGMNPLGFCPYGVTPDRLSPTTPARIRAMETSLTVETASPRKIIPAAAAPAAPMPVHTA